ncbi:MAG: glutamine-hydrolyzing GMP synthase [Deltaproteobacteria bacterium]|nr:glutamine-hydrolyzing GMP synthase [Deltaproteobacteria bacterium]
MILIIDFGSQYNQLIARRVRESRVYCQIEPYNIGIDKIKALAPKGIVLSGGPMSIYDKKSPKVDKRIFDLDIPILGICYGLQFMIDALKGGVKKAEKREYGFAALNIKREHALFAGIDKTTECWMSHGDSIYKLPKGFSLLASTDNTEFTAVANEEKKLYGFQFHPEVAHTPKGKKMLENFAINISGAKRDWTMKFFAKKAISEIKGSAKNDKVILGLSGGVDSTVTSVLLDKALGKNFTAIFVDNGLLRKNEADNLKGIFKERLKINVKFINAEDRFLDALKKVTDPEKKRKIIGKIFADIFEEEARKIEGVKFLAQGTLYPDIIESVSVFGGPSAVIKSHHNVGGLPKDMKLKLIEPLKYLFKDEVRKLGKTLGVNSMLIWRQPFPGPGLAIRVIGEVTKERLEVLRKADAILLEEIHAAGYYKKLWQSFAVLLPIKSVGVMGDSRTYENIAAIRAVTSKDAMTADWAKLPQKLLGKISNRIINEVSGINRVVYDISSKPPATIEWE